MYLHFYSAYYSLHHLIIKLSSTYLLFFLQQAHRTKAKPRHMIKRNGGGYLLIHDAANNALDSNAQLLETDRQTDRQTDLYISETHSLTRSRSSYTLGSNPFPALLIQASGRHKVGRHLLISPYLVFSLYDSSHGLLNPCFA